MDQIAQIVAPVATTIAALMVAANLGSRVTGFGFIMFSVGSVAWAVVGLSSGQSGLLWQNVVLVVVNMIGVWRWLGLRARYERGAAVATRTSASES